MGARFGELIVARLKGPKVRSFSSFQTQLISRKTMSHGGRRAGSGRKKSGTNRLDTKARQQAMESGISPLDYMLSIMRNPDSTAAQKMEAAKAAAPYVHARLAHIERKEDVSVSFVARLPSPASSVEGCRRSAPTSIDEPVRPSSSCLIYRPLERR
jgi:hypothetical protein